jgi:hypothetical protein
MVLTQSEKQARFRIPTVMQGIARFGPFTSPGHRQESIAY